MRQQRQVMDQFILSIVAYAVLLSASIAFLKAVPESAWRIPVALAPVIPAVLILATVARAVALMDEMQRKIQFEAVVLSFCGTAILTFGYGFLENVGFPHLNWTFVLPLMAALWGIGQLVATRRYR